MKKIITGVIIGGIVFALGGVIAATTISSQNVTYQDKTVNSALDELYNEATTGKELVAAAITNKGVATTSSDTYETMAFNIDKIKSSGDIDNLKQHLKQVTKSYTINTGKIYGTTTHKFTIPEEDILLLTQATVPKYGTINVGSGEGQGTMVCNTSIDFLTNVVTMNFSLTSSSTRFNGTAVLLTVTGYVYVE